MGARLLRERKDRLFISTSASASGASSGHFFFDALIFAHRFFWAAEINARAAALILRFFVRPLEAVDAGEAVPSMLASSLCSFSIRSLMDAARRS